MDMEVWLTAVDNELRADRIAGLVESDARVALALADGKASVGSETGRGCTDDGYHCDECGCLPALTEEQFQDSLEELLCAGFLEAPICLGCSDESHLHYPGELCGDTIFEFSLPHGYQEPTK